MTTTHPANFLRELNASLAAIGTTPATDSEILMVASLRACTPQYAANVIREMRRPPTAIAAPPQHQRGAGKEFTP